MDAKEKGYLSNRLSFLIKLNCAITIGFKNFVRIFSPITLFHKTTKEQALYKLCHASYRIIYTWDYQSGGFNSGIHRSRNTRRATGLSKTQLRVPARSHKRNHGSLSWRNKYK